MFSELRKSNICKYLVNICQMNELLYGIYTRICMMNIWKYMESLHGKLSVSGRPLWALWPLGQTFVCFLISLFTCKMDIMEHSRGLLCSSNKSAWTSVWHELWLEELNDTPFVSHSKFKIIYFYKIWGSTLLFISNQLCHINRYWSCWHFGRTYFLIL